MITQKQRSDLIEAYKDEPLCVAGTLIKCAACLLVIGGLALIGTTRESTHGPAEDAHLTQDLGGKATTSEMGNGVANAVRTTAQPVTG